MTAAQLESLSQEFLASAGDPHLFKERYELLSGALNIYKYLHENGFTLEDPQKKEYQEFSPRMGPDRHNGYSKKLVAGEPISCAPEVAKLIARSAKVRVGIVKDIGGYLEKKNTTLDLELLSLIPSSIALEMFDEMASWQD